MRDIRFRAWSKEHKVMFNVGGLTNMDYPQDHQYRYATIGSPDGTMPDSTPQIKTLELMQFTGLLDKNGKEIYEGDIVQAPYDSPAQVVFDKYVTDNEHNEDIMGWCAMKADKYIALDPQSVPAWEVIGNVHENSDLASPQINGKKDVEK